MSALRKVHNHHAVKSLAIIISAIGIAVVVYVANTFPQESTLPTEVNAQVSPR